MVTILSYVGIVAVPLLQAIIQINSCQDLENNIKTSLKTSFNAPMHYVVYFAFGNLILIESFSFYNATMIAIVSVFSKYFTIK